MAFSLSLPPAWAVQGWKVKIRDRERLEPPHVSILHGVKVWRLCLRTGRFLDAKPSPKDVPEDLVALIRGATRQLREEWDAMYPDNPVLSVRSTRDN